MSKQWKIVDHPSIPGMIVIEGPAFRLVICAQATNITSSDYLRIMADARLIAAAPEMYELLADISGAATIETPTDVLERVNTLLAKIEGGGDAA